MNETILLICLAFIVIAAIACAMFRSMLKCAVSLAVVSALLACVLYLMGATWAALFELSVCAGLVTVVFASAISLTSTSRHQPENEEEHRKRVAGLPFILSYVSNTMSFLRVAAFVLVHAGMMLVVVIAATGFHIEPQANAALVGLSFKDVLWNMRQADVLGQIIVILAGAFAVAILFKESDKA